MTVGIVDSTVIVHLLRGNQAALTWFSSLNERHLVTPITWLEVIYGAGSKVAQTRCKAILSKFDLEYLTAADQAWAMEQMENLRLSNGVSINDCLITSVANRMQIPLYTDNLKHMNVLLSATLVVKPY